MKPITSSTAPLTADQLRVAQLFASMDDETQQAMLAMMVAMAAARPRHSSQHWGFVGVSDLILKTMFKPPPWRWCRSR
jgi:hypothetical protein